MLFARQYLNQAPAIREVTMAVNIRVTKKLSLIIPASKATVAKTIAGPPRAFIAVAKLKLESQEWEQRRAARVTAMPWIIIASMRNSKKNIGSK